MGRCPDGKLLGSPGKISRLGICFVFVFFLNPHTTHTLYTIYTTHTLYTRYTTHTIHNIHDTEKHAMYKDVI